MKCMEIYLTMKVRDQEFNRVKQLKFLEFILMEKIDIGKKVAPRILSGNKCFYRLAVTVVNILVKVTANKIIYHNITPNNYIWSRNMSIRETDYFKRKILKLFRLLIEEETNVWNIRNKRLEKLSRKNMLLDIIQSRLQWSRHT